MTVLTDGTRALVVELRDALIASLQEDSDANARRVRDAFVTIVQAVDEDDVDALTNLARAGAGLDVTEETE